MIYREVLAKYGQESHLARAARLGLSKLQIYSTKIREIPVYIAAVVLHPRQKWNYFELAIE